MSYLRMAKEAEARLRAARRDEGGAEARWPALDWTNAVSVCLVCGWYGMRRDFDAHRDTDEHRRGEELAL